MQDKVIYVILKVRMEKKVKLWLELDETKFDMVMR